MLFQDAQYVLRSGVARSQEEEVLMGHLSRMVWATRDTISLMVLVWLVTTVIGYGGLHHVVLGTVEVMAGVASNQGVSLRDYGHFLAWTTLGNALGGSVFVALIKYGHAHVPAEAG
jgi:formate/nitrite transporter FocA (FNT family)